MSLMMSSAPINAHPPFNHPKADIILRSSDNVDFRVFKQFLSPASPFFETLFEIPQPAEASEEPGIEDGLVVPMAEDSETLGALLCFCYPPTLVDDPPLEAFEDVVRVLEAAQKYSLDAIEKKVCCTFLDPKILAAEPFRCFAIARRAQLQEGVLLAARYTLTQPLIPLWFEEIDFITASELLALLSYHRECGSAVYGLKNDLLWILSHYGSSQGCTWLSGKYADGKCYGRINYSECRCPRSPTPKYRVFEPQSLQWWEDFMEETFVALLERPCGATVESFVAKTVQKVRRGNCPTCSAHISEGMRDFSELLAKKVDEVVSRVTLKL